MTISRRLFGAPLAAVAAIALVLLLERFLFLARQGRRPERLASRISSLCAGGDFDFAVLKATTADEISAAVDWLLTHDHDYKTLDTDYMESVMWALKTLWDKGLMYEGFRVLWYCWHCETPLSNTETEAFSRGTRSPLM